MTLDTNSTLGYCKEPFECDPYGPAPTDEDLAKVECMTPWIINMMLDCGELNAPAELAEMLGVSESWLLDDFVKAYELLSTFFYLTDTEFTINRRAMAQDVTEA